MNIQQSQKKQKDMTQQKNQKTKKAKWKKRHQGDEYKTESQEIQYYNLTEIPENAEGTMNVEVVKGEDGEEIINNQTIVTYAYKKKEFNLTVDKTIYSITQNAQERLVGTD